VALRAALLHQIAGLIQVDGYRRNTGRINRHLLDFRRARQIRPRRAADQYEREHEYGQSDRHQQAVLVLVIAGYQHFDEKERRQDHRQAEVSGNCRGSVAAPVPEASHHEIRHYAE